MSITDVLMAISQGLVSGTSGLESAVGARVLALRPDGAVTSALAFERYTPADPVAVITPKIDEPPDPEYPW